MELDTSVKLAVYGHFAESGRAPDIDTVARRAATTAGVVRDAYRRLQARRLLVLEPDGASIRMAPPFSGVATQHAVDVDGISYHANCAWDALGVTAALHRAGTVRSRCEQSGEPLEMRVGIDGPEPSDWLFHCPVPASRWWADIVFT